LVINNPINASHAFQIGKLIRGRHFENLDVILHSSGGQINPAYQIISLIKSHSDNLTVIIPIYAKSAATLFVLGCSKIIMGELAELGPLDTQLLERREGSRIYSSALNPFKTLEELQRFALQMFDQSVRLLLQRADYSIEEAVKHSMDFSSRIVAPLFSQIKVDKMGEYSRALQIGLEYGRRISKRYGNISEECYGNILQKLVFQYPSHDYIIDAKEMEEIGLNVAKPTDEEGEIIHEMMVELFDSMHNRDDEDEIALIDPEEEQCKTTPSTEK